MSYELRFKSEALGEWRRLDNVVREQFKNKLADTVEISHVLMAVGLDPAWAKGTLRFSLWRPTTEDEIDRAAEVVCTAVEHLAGACWDAASVRSGPTNQTVPSSARDSKCSLKIPFRPGRWEAPISSLTPSSG